MAELPKTYDPKTVEPKWYQRWLDAGAFHANAKSTKPAFSIVIPPPNITGVLTLGHVLNNTIQDILARRARMQGREVMWLPGMDHAGIGTQTAVEKWLRKNEGVTRHDLGREEFLRRVLEWQDKHGGIIIQQLKRLGCSCDWSRQRYTFGADYIQAVQKVFVDLYQKGLIYRGRRMINWDPAAQTALSDEEVMSKPQKGSLYFVRYEVVDEPGRFLEVATTRPETIMADTALAVHPNDKRYKDLVGKQVWRPLAREKLPIVADEAIDPEFGTGVLKVTPAHDKVDFEVGQRHKLPIVDVLTESGRINCPAAPELHGLDRFEARKRAAELLKERGLLAKTEPYENNVAFSDRSEVPIEPRISEQWFLRYPKTEEALAVVREHLIRFYPAHWEKVYAQWLEHIQDWCISRQVWWGHRIPAWYARQRSEVRDQRSGEIYVGIEPPADAENWQQDEDTLDTWFSSWLWAYETMDPETRAKFYPTSVLVTGPDIIFFWVARMIIAGLEFKPGKSERDQDNIPFHDVFFTGIIRDKQGRKMSKSLGNSPDPLDLIANYGADGLRFGLMRIAPSGQDIRFDEKQIEEGRNFATKLWNAARFRQMHGPSNPNLELKESELSIYGIEALARLSETIGAVEAAYRHYQFNAVAQQLYNFVWGDFCDWFVEAGKTDIFGEDQARKQSTLATMDYILSAIIRLLHPFMPHLTEELWSLMGFAKAENEFLDFAPLPQAMALDEAIQGKARIRVGAIYETVEAGRNLRAEARVPSNQKAKFALRSNESWAKEEGATIARLLNAESLKIDANFQPPSRSSVAATKLGELFLIAGEMNRAAERERLDREIAKLEAELRATEAKLANASFIERAPKEVVEEHQRRRDDFNARLVQLWKARAPLD
ncbi:MAG: valine--tRNA ligase [Verrucomicrobia bacterium]|nr:MAG: valine--tRNA ligase [Verrucomicrobiota bacterium]